MASAPASTGEKHLIHTFRVQAETTALRGIEDRRIKLEMRSLEAAIRARLWRMIFQRVEER